MSEHRFEKNDHLNPPFAATVVASALSTAIPGRPGLQPIGLKNMRQPLIKRSYQI